jgi:hypothetical protein
LQALNAPAATIKAMMILMGKLPFWFCAYRTSIRHRLLER